MTRTEAPKDLVGRGEVNLARTTPELPKQKSQYGNSMLVRRNGFTVRSGDLAPDHTDLGSADLLLASVDESDLLAKVEAVRHD